MTDPITKRNSVKSIITDTIAKKNSVTFGLFGLANPKNLLRENLYPSKFPSLS